MLKSLIALRLKALGASCFGRTKNGQPPSALKKSLMGLLFAYVIAVYASLFAMMFLGLCQPLYDTGLQWLYYAIAAFLSLGMGVIGSVFATQSQLYDATDNEFLLSMPVPPRYILISRMLALYLTNLAFTALSMLPAIVIGMIFGAFSWRTLILGILGTLLLPLGSLTLSCILGALLAYISSKLPNKTIASVAFTIVCLAVYFYGLNNTDRAMTYVLGHLTQTQAFISRVGIRASLLGKAMAGMGWWYVPGFALSVILPLLIVLFVLDRSFIGIATRQKGVKRRAYRLDQAAPRSQDRALLFKELKHFSSSASWMLNGGLGLIFMLVGPIMALRGASFLDNMLALIPQLPQYMPLALAAYECLVLTIVPISAASVSLEGRSWWLTRSMPVETKRILLAKARMQILIALPFTLLACALGLLTGVRGALVAVASFLWPVSFVWLTAYLGVALNARFPNLDWISESAPVKQGLAVALSMGAALGILILPVLLWALWGTDVLSPDVAALFIAALNAGITLSLRRWLMTAGAKRYDKLGE